MSKEVQLQTYEKLAQKAKPINKKRVFLKERRIELLSNAKGQVLEVAVGRGTNFQFYPPNVEITAVDFSPSLLEMAKSTATAEGISVEFIESDIERLEFKEDAFDTIVSTLSLCAYDDPVGVLKKFSKFCRPDGQILLLEHGLSSNQAYGKALNILLHQLDGWNVKNMGCHTNRDILDILKESHLEIKKIEAYLLSTHYLVIAKPKKD